MQLKPELKLSSRLNGNRGKILTVQEYIDNHDFDFLDGCNNKINIYCDECSCSNLVKL